MFFIGKSVKPRYFLISGVVNLPCRYMERKKSWMDSGLFEKWVREQYRKCEREGRKVAIIVDNCATQPITLNLKAINFLCLLSNNTSKTQQMDSGAIRSTKAYYGAVICEHHFSLSPITRTSSTNC